MSQFVQIIDNKVTALFSCFQDPDVWPGVIEVEDDDPRYVAFINPPPDLLAINSAVLQSANQLAAAQKTALANRIGVIKDAIEFEEATPAELAELPVRETQLTAWKRYAVLLGRVTAQAGWYATVVWPEQPAAGMDLTVSAITPETV